MLGGAPKVLFHVQAGSRIGIGHLARARAVMEALKELGIDCVVNLDVDYLGMARAHDWGLVQSSSMPVNTSALVIDARTISPAQAEILRRFAPRILISPVFNRADIVTHALLRAAPPQLLSDLPDTVVLNVKMDYAFATARGLSPRMLGFDQLEIGLCLSGGLDPMEPVGVLSLLAGIKHVAGIRVIDPRIPVPLKKHIQHVSSADQPWKFFDGINVFIGGNGVMLAEAIAQGLPSISLSTRSEKARNVGLLASGALRIIERGASMLPTLATVLGQRSLLEEMHRAALKLDGARHAARISQDIKKILKDRS